MADTHINAFFGAVAEAEKEMVVAHAKWEAAKAALEVKKKEVSYVETPSSKSEEDSSTEDKKVDQDQKKKK